MADLFVLFTSLTVFGVGVTILDFLGIMDHFGSSDGDGHGSDARLLPIHLPTADMRQQTQAVMTRIMFPSTALFLFMKTDILKKNQA